MTLSNPKPLGWAFGEFLTSAQMNSIASQLPNAVDGIGGGTYSLTNELRLEDDLVYIETLQARDATIDEDASVGASGTGSLSVATNLTVGGDATVGDDLTVVDDATVGGDLAVAGIASFLINNSQVNAANETLFDGFQSTPLRYYTGSTGALQTTLSNTTTVYHWFILVNAQSTTRFVHDEATGLNLSLASNSWCIVAKISSLNAWKVCAQGTFTNFA